MDNEILASYEHLIYDCSIDNPINKSMWHILVKGIV